MGNCNTVEYWNKVWSKWRKEDDPRNLLAQSVNASLQDYWDLAFEKPEHLAKYSVQRAWWYAKQNNASSVLDVGCGNGRLLYGMKCLLPDAALYGIDFSDVGINRMKKEYGIRGKAMDIFDLDSL